MGQALYRKYRSKNLSEIVGQEHITSTLTNALKNNQISHAYLFTGPRGVGKTSVARILAHEVNGFKYDDNENYLDIIEIDAASNRRIDEIRQLRDRVNIAPSSGKYKVYIIDEVHMLTREAFNALLKTLEEPPEHAIFILATTEAHKVPETIVSRTQQFNFRPIPAAQVADLLKVIATKEKISIDDKALQIIAEYGQGSFRDSIGLLDQASSINKKITENELISLLGLAPSKIITQIINAIENKSIIEVLEALKTIDENGYNITVICKQLLSSFKEYLLNNSTLLSSEEILSIMKKIIDVPASHDSSTMLELILIESALTNDKASKLPGQKLIEKIAKPIVKEKVSSQPKQPQESSFDPSPTTVKEVKSDGEVLAETKPKSKSKKIDITDEDLWNIVLDSLKVKYNTLYGIVRMAIPNFQKDELILKTKFDFHQRLLNDAKNQLLIINIIEDLTGEIIKIRSIVDKNIDLESRKDDEKEKVDNNAPITTINNIFGSSEVIK
jgi:DNA polymerase-3 subunit gamma/tau